MMKYLDGEELPATRMIFALDTEQYAEYMDQSFARMDELYPAGYAEAYDQMFRALYELTGEDIGKTISVRITAKGYAGTIETEAEGTVTVYYSVSYDTEVGGTLAMDRAEGGKNYTLRSDWDSMGFRAPDKKTFDKWLIDGVAYEAGTTYVVEHDVSVTPLWKDVKSDDDDGPKPPVPTPDDPVKPPVPAPDDKWHNHKGNGTNNGADGAA